MNIRLLNNVKRFTKEFWKITNTSVRQLSVWTQDKIVKSPYKDIDVPNCSLYDYVWQNLDKWPEKTATICAETGKKYTYQEVYKQSNVFGSNLRKKFGIHDGDVIAVILPNIPEFPSIFMGIVGAGAVITTYNPMSSTDQITRQLLSCNVELIITLPELFNKVKDSSKLAEKIIPIIVVKTHAHQIIPEGAGAFNELSEDKHVDVTSVKNVTRNITDICFLPYSSGTTGIPKGVELTYKNVIATCEQLNEPKIRCNEETTDTYQDALLASTPFFHIYGALITMLHRVSQGCKLVTMSKFEPESYLQTIQRHKINVLFTNPQLVLSMTSQQKLNPKIFDSVRTIMCGASPLFPADIERFLKKINRQLDFRQGYGNTEVAVAAMAAVGSNNMNSVGLPVPSTEFKIVDEHLNTLGPNQKGELLIRGPQVMKSYINNHPARKEIFTPDGWYKTKDYAFINGSGELTIMGRLIDNIKVDGHQVPSAELEGVLREHPAVNEAAVIAVPHPTKGEAPKAYIVLKQGASATVDDIKNFVKDKLAPHKSIEQVVFLEGLSKTPTGKTLKRLMK